MQTGRNDKLNHAGRSNQAFASAVVLIALVGIAVGIGIKQGYYDETQFKITLVQEGIVGVGDAASASSAGFDLESLKPDGVVVMSALEIFDEETLSEKINGKAELYLAAGFVSLAAQRFYHEEDEEAWFEFYLYDMGEPRNAFSVFSSQKRSNALDSDLAGLAYLSENAVFFATGNYYVEIVGSEVNEHLISAMQQMAAVFIDTVSADTVRLPEIELLPVEGMEADTVRLLSQDVFGYSEFNNTVTVTYRINDHELMAFISRRPDREKARALAEGYVRFLKMVGAESLGSDLLPGSAALMDLIGTYEIVFFKGDVVAGVHGAMDRNSAEALAIRIYETIP